jgi:uncharacterized protein YceK
VKHLPLLIAIVTLAGCSSTKTLQEAGAEEYWPYGGIRRMNENYPQKEWGKARYPAMIMDAPFSFTFDTVGFFCHPAFLLGLMEGYAAHPH